MPTVSDIQRTQSYQSLLLDARAFCSTIENIDRLPTNDICATLQRQLLSLYKNGQDLNLVSIDTGDSAQKPPPKEELKSIIDSLSFKLPERYYWHVFEPTQQNDLEPVCGDLADDLGDIYEELKNAVLLIDTGRLENIQHGMWNLKFGFDAHWGRHCIDAIYALHYFSSNQVR